MADRGVGFSEALCKALGLPPKKITRLTLYLDPTDAIRVDAEVLPDGDELRAARQVVARYRFKVER